MITVLDNQSWAKELFTGNGAYIETAGVLYIVSNVRADNTFAILKSNPVPPDPGPGASFTTVKTFTFSGTQVDFDPVVAYDSGNTKLHIVGVRTNPSNSNLADIIKFTYNTVSTTLTGPVVLATGTRVRDAYDVAVLATGGCMVGLSVDEAESYLDGAVTPSTGMSLVVMQLDSSDAVVAHSTVELLNSPPRSGDAYSSVSLISPDGVKAELYLESHSKLVTFADQVFKLRMLNYAPTVQNVSAVSENASNVLTITATNRFAVGTVIALAGMIHATYLNGQNVTVLSSNGTSFTATDPTSHGTLAQVSETGTATPTTPVWDPAVTELTVFQGRYTDDRLTVIANGTTRLLTQVYFNQSTHPLGLVGNLFMGILIPPAGWNFHTEFGTVQGGSIVQATAAIDAASAMHIAFLLEPFGTASTNWPLHVATLGTDLTFTDVPNWYNGQNFTWLRGTKSFIDNGSVWSLVGERVSGANITPVYVSFFNVPPIVNVAPTSATVYRGAVGYSLGGPILPGDLTLVATSADADQDPIEFVWTKSDQDLTDIKLTPNGNRATLDIKRAVGGAARTFAVGVAAIDLEADLVTPIHPAFAVTNIDVTGGVLTVTAVNALAGSEQTMLYNLVLDPPTSVTITPVTSGSLPSRTYFVRVTYINPAGETLGSARQTVNLGSGQVLSVSPTASAFADATAFNVYASETSGQEVQQTITPVALGSFFQEPNGGLISGPPTPTVSTAFMPKAFNDVVLTVATASGSQFTVNPFTAPSGVWNGGVGTFSGSGIPQFQFSVCAITVPSNAAPAIGTLSPISAARNAVVTIAPTITGVVDDPDDLPSYTWTQTSGTTVTATNGFSSPTLIIQTNGVDVHGETLTFHLVAGDGVNANAQQDFEVDVAAYDLTHTDTNFLARAIWTTNGTTPATISQRNTAQTWGVLQVSSMLTDFQAVKRTSVLDGSDRYIIISGHSVLVYGGVNPVLYLLRKLLTPSNTTIIDALHVEQDYTLVMDQNYTLFRYSTAPLINTDNPDTTIELANISSFRFNKMFTTPTFADIRVLFFTGPDGILMLQVKSSTLQILATAELSTVSNFIYGSNNVQFIRTSNVESLRQGKLLIGTITPLSATITALRVLDNDALVTADNNFVVGTKVVFSGITHIPDLNGRELVVTQANSVGFQCSVLHADAGTGPNYTDTGTATATNAGTTFETLVDLTHGQIVGTWDASKLRNQRVESGEILFEQESTYVGRPPAPVQAAPTKNGSDVTVSWSEERPDLVFAYDVQISLDGGATWSVLARVNSGATQQLTATLIPGSVYKFRIQAFSVDGASNFSNIQTITV